MKTYLDCIPCFVNQTLRAGRLVTNDEKILKQLLDKSGEMIKNIPLHNTPAETGAIVYENIRVITGVEDPYKKIKEENIKQAKALYPKLKELIKTSENKLLTALRIAVAGNVIDLGVAKKFDIEKDLEVILKQDFGIFNFDLFQDHLKKAKNILYIGDNAGESVFDKILIEEMNKPTIFVVREAPIINDATYEDAIQSGLHEVAEIVSSGSRAPGTILSLCNEKFLKLFEEADMVISKGQGNYEGLSDVKRSVFFLLKAKCYVIAHDLKLKEGDIVLKAINL